MLLNNLKYEQPLWNKGIKYIAGIDEVGRGPLAGPFVVCAIILDAGKISDLLKINDVQSIETSFYSQITDSKLISNAKRRYLDQKIRNECISYSIVAISNHELDSLGISKATQVAFSKAVTKLKVSAEHVFTDLFRIPDLPLKKQTNLKGGDRVSITVAAASIVAKVHRDNLMLEMHKKYPMYEFDKNKGYGTLKHLQALKSHGPCEIHRCSFEPVKSMLFYQDSV